MELAGRQRGVGSAIFGMNLTWERRTTLFVAGCVILYALFSKFFVNHIIVEEAFSAFAVIIALSLIGARVTYAHVPLAVRVLYRSIMVICTFYIATSHIAVPDSLLENAPLSASGLKVLWLVMILSGCLALIRPSFGLMTAEYILVNKIFLGATFGGLAITPTDYITLIDSGAFLAVGITLFGLIAGSRWGGRLWSSEGAPSAPSASGTQALHPLIILTLAMIAMHFGNYFYGALFKMSLGEHIWSWALENRTFLLILMGLESHVLPISFSPSLVQHAYDAFAFLYLPFNLAVLVAQFLCIFALNKLRWTIAVTLFYDAMHLGIFLLTGIFFWKWILLNLAIVAALSLVPRGPIPLQHRVLVMALVFLSPYVYKIPPFAWLDTPAVNTLHILAVTDAGETLEVPNNYFLPLSVTFVQQRMQWPARGKFPTTTWGTTRQIETLAAMSDCEDARPVDAWRPFGYSRDKISTILRRYHEYVLSAVDDRGLLNYDLYPHHIFTMPWEQQAFRSFDKRRIVAYRYESESVCLSLKDGRLQKHVKRSHGFDIPLDKT